MSHFKDITEFLAMGGYAEFVWTAFASVFASLGILFSLGFVRFRRVKRQVLESIMATKYDKTT